FQSSSRQPDDNPDNPDKRKNPGTRKNPVNSDNPDNPDDPGDPDSGMAPEIHNPAGDGASSHEALFLGGGVPIFGPLKEAHHLNTSQ
ncbi:hypothetical protein E4U43_008014, partial [Claviceps pusilla]